jgi:N-acetylglucosaminyldiphosphoundecaprenol N-acetyl-beta-D-mannosaminyltransferase
MGEVMGALGNRAPDTGRSKVLGIDCFVGDLPAAAGLVVTRARSREGGYACLGNVHVLVTAQHDERLRLALEAAWAVFPDGAPVAWLQRRAGHAATRIGGPDLMPLAIESGLSPGIRHFLLGSRNSVLDTLCRVIERTYPGVRLAGSYSPSSDEVDRDHRKLLDHIRAAKPDIVWCAFGAPRQELWMSRHAEAVAPAVLVGVGAAFDFIAGAKPRAPSWMQRSGFEWLHRLAHEPRRLGGRYLRTNTEFIIRGLAQLTASWAADRTRNPNRP